MRKLFQNVVSSIKSCTLSCIIAIAAAGCGGGQTASSGASDSSTPASVAMPTDKWFAVVNRESGLAFDIDSFVTEPGAALTQWTRADTENQLFRLVASGDNYYRMLAQHSSLALDVMDFNVEEGADIVQWDDLNGENQQFRLLDLHNGYHQIINRLSNKALAPESFSDVAGERISQYLPNSRNEAQHWELVEVADYHDTAVDAGEGDYYVALDGNDSNPGTFEQPFRSVQRAIDIAEPGDLVLVRGGVYNIADPAIPEAGVNFWKSGGSENNRIRYFAFPGERPVFDFSNIRLRPDPNYTYGFLVTGAYLHLKGFEVRNLPMNTRSNIGVSVSGGAHHNIFELFDIHHISGAGMFIHTTTGGHLILNSDSHDNYDPFSHQGDGQNADGFGVHYQKTGDVTIFRGCRAWWNSDDGWDFISQEVPVIVENSWAMGNGYIDSGNGRPADGNGAGFKIGSSKTGVRHIVRNNLAWGNRSKGFYANHSTGGNDWFNNTAIHNGVQFDMLASFWDANGNRTDGVILTGDRVHRMRNNIAYPHNNRSMEGVDSQFNSWDLGLQPRDSDFISVDDSGTKGPRAADGSLPTLGFLRLRDGSQMIDRGTEVGLPFSLQAPDLGAHEK